MSPTIRLLIACPDTRGIIAAVSGFLAEHHGNIVDLDQHSDLDHGEFFMRVEVEREGFSLGPVSGPASGSASFEAAWAPLATRFQMNWSLGWRDRPKRMAVLVSRQTHCLSDLGWRWQAGELDADLVGVYSNHREAEPLVRQLGLPFEHLPIDPGHDPAAARSRQEAALRGRLEAAGVEVVVLARYMQVLSPAFVAAWPGRILNIHHSFLPAFAGGSPYKQAYERGVKMIGATSHYVTEQLDDGPIIAQETTATSHRDTVADLVRKGRDLERVVLARAVRLHLEDRILVSKNRTVVFD